LTRPLRVLVLGGTGFIGPHFVRAARARGHRVSVFNRGRNPGLIDAGVQRLCGDRKSDLRSIESREWDVVLDLASYVPRWIRTLGERITRQVKHYTLISTAAVYENPAANREGTDEECSVLSYQSLQDPYGPEPDVTLYGELKVLCEREAELQFPGRTLILRPGSIVGPHDPVGAFTYWLARADRGGSLLAFGDPSSVVQFIDVRDLAEWAIQMAENGETGVYNAVGPASRMTSGEMLEAICEGCGIAADITCVPLAWVAQQNLSIWESLYFWMTEGGRPGLMQLRNERARSRGLKFRPLSETIVDSLAWYRSLEPMRRCHVLMGSSEFQSLHEVIRREREVMVMWQAERGCGPGRTL
jgi:2'-hydroxyisoflavone reductase